MKKSKSRIKTIVILSEAKRQAAIVFELRHFRRYYDFTERMLVRLKHDWMNDPKTSANPLTPVMLEEVELTLKHIARSK